MQEAHSVKASVFADPIKPRALIFKAANAIVLIQMSE